jgi:Flp pilus assembly protein TadD
LPERPFRFIHRDIVILLALCALAIVAFLLTRDAAASNRALFLRDAAVWYDTGLRALDEGRAADAVQALRRATNMSGDDQEYRLTLAQALAVSGQDELARGELLALRDLSPEDPGINVELARLEARGTDLEAAQRYYEYALYGLWSEEEADARSLLRVELVRYLLDQGQESPALSETLALVGNMPDTTSWQIEAAGLFMAAGDAGRALDRFAFVLETEPDNGPALAGGGRAAFALDDFARARRFLTDAPDDLEEVTELRAVSDFVLTRDPLAPRLSTEQRRQRLIANMARSRERLSECAAVVTVSPALALAQKEIADFEPLLQPEAFRDSSDTVETGIDLVLRVEQAAARVCGAPTKLDRALAIIGRLDSAEPQ